MTTFIAAIESVMEIPVASGKKEQKEAANFQVRKRNKGSLL